jgi:hypothetical protein
MGLSEPISLESLGPRFRGDERDSQSLPLPDTRLHTR